MKGIETAKCQLALLFHTPLLLISPGFWFCLAYTRYVVLLKVLGWWIALEEKFWQSRHQSLWQGENWSHNVLGRTCREMEKKSRQQCWAVSTYCAHGRQLQPVHPPASGKYSPGLTQPCLQRRMCTCRNRILWLNVGQEKCLRHGKLKLISCDRWGGKGDGSHKEVVRSPGAFSWAQLTHQAGSLLAAAGFAQELQCKTALQPHHCCHAEPGSSVNTQPN